MKACSKKTKVTFVQARTAKQHISKQRRRFFWSLGWCAKWNPCITMFVFHKNIKIIFYPTPSLGITFIIHNIRWILILYN